MTFITPEPPTNNNSFSPCQRQSDPENDEKMFLFLQAAAAAAAKPAQYTGTYQANATGYQATYAQPAAQTTIAAQPTTQAKREYTRKVGVSYFYYSRCTQKLTPPQRIPDTTQRCIRQRQCTSPSRAEPLSRNLEVGKGTRKAGLAPKT